MPATPRFKMSQTDLAVIVCIKVPHVRVGNAETYVDGKEFSFYCKPYLLRLSLPHEVGGEDDDGSCKAVYDPADDNGTITVTLKKVIPGQHFPDLDLTTTLMQPRWTPKDLLKDHPESAGERRNGGPPASSGIEVLSSEHYDVPDDDDEGGPTGPAAEGVALGGGAAPGGERGRGAGAEEEMMIRPPTYGFNNRFSGFFSALRDELREMVHLPDPDNTPASARRELRLEHEECAFDADRYLGDLFPEEEDPLLTEALAFEPHWHRRLQTQRRRRRRQQQQQQQQQEEEGQRRQQLQEENRGKWSKTKEQDARKGEGAQHDLRQQEGRGGRPNDNDEDLPRSSKEELVGGGGGFAEGGGGSAKSIANEEEDEEERFSEKEQEQMRRLPNREYLIEPGGMEERRVLLGLADILFAYAYDHRTTTGDASVESAWTVAVLSPLLSWLEAAPVEEEQDCQSGTTPNVDAYSTMEARVALGGIRRSLIYPYLRVWELGALVARDVRDILSAGKRCILRCLLQAHAIMERGEVHYLLNKLFIEDYCVWIQKASERSLEAFAERYAVAAESIAKEGTGLNLEALEAEAVGLMAAADDAEGHSSEEESSSESECSEESSDGDSSDGNSSEDGDAEDDTEEEGSTGGEGIPEAEASVPEVEQMEKKTEEAHTLPTSSAAAGRGLVTVSGDGALAHAATTTAATAAATAAAKVNDGEAAPTDMSKGSLGGNGQHESTTSSTFSNDRAGIDGDGGGIGGTEKASSDTASTASHIGVPSKPPGSEGVKRSSDLLQLEALGDSGGAADGEGGTSSSLASQLAVMCLGKQRETPRPGVAVLEGGGVKNLPPPPPPPPCP